MSIGIIQERLAAYACNSTLEEEQALREITQEIILAGLLCRSYLKGRDWYDFIWYTARRTPIKRALLSAALDQQGPWKGEAPQTDNAWCVEQLLAMIAESDWTQARRDVQRFVKPHELPSLELWTRDYFLQQCAKLGESSSPEP